MKEKQRYVIPDGQTTSNLSKKVSTQQEKIQHMRMITSERTIKVF